MVSNYYNEAQAHHGTSRSPIRHRHRESFSPHLSDNLRNESPPVRTSQVSLRGNSEFEEYFDSNKVQYDNDVEDRFFFVYYIIYNLLI